MLLRLFRAVYRSKPCLICAVLFEIAVSLVMELCLHRPVQSHNAGTTLDLRFGYTADDVLYWLYKLGPGGREEYLRMVQWDIFPYMPAYTILLGSLLLMESERVGGQYPSELALAAPVVMVCDAVETCLNGYATKIFPQEMSKRLVLVSSVANMLKWVCFAQCLLLLAYLFVSNRISPRKGKEKISLKSKKEG